MLELLGQEGYNFQTGTGLVASWLMDAEGLLGDSAH